MEDCDGRSKLQASDAAVSITPLNVDVDLNTIDTCNAAIVKSEKRTECCGNWIKLTSDKEFSRLLYPNPVCFLSTGSSTSIDCNSVDDYSQPLPSLSPLGREEHGGTFSKRRVQANRNVMVLSWLTATNNAGGFMFSIHKSRHSTSLLSHPKPLPLSSSVGVSSSKNASMSKTPFTTSVPSRPETGVEFVLSVPVKGMECLVLDVGAISGKYGSKFPSDNVCGDNSCHSDDAIEINNNNSFGKVTSNRQRKKQRRKELASCGVAGLRTIPLGGRHAGFLDKKDGSVSTSEEATENERNISQDDESGNQDVKGDKNRMNAGLFAIDGTVAHLRCRTCAVLGTLPSKPAATVEPTATGMDSTSSKTTIRQDHLEVSFKKDRGEATEQFDKGGEAAIDEDHWLILAEVVEAFVHPNYWDKEKLLFCPSNNDADYVPPYLTFLGAQTFGYVVTEPITK